MEIKMYRVAHRFLVTTAFLTSLFFPRPCRQAVLDAVGIVNGPAHAEVMLTPTGPCLVEVGSRCHGGEGTWQRIANECVGYNQITTTIDAYLEEGKFMALPDAPTELRMAGREAFVVARESGVLRATPGFDEIRGMTSYLSEEVRKRAPNAYGGISKGTKYR